MALVKCPYCGKYFDREKEDYVKVKNRYAHKSCAEEYKTKITQEEKDKLMLNQYIMYLFHQNYVPPRAQSQIKLYLNAPYNYTYKGIFRALKYWYEVKKSDITKARGGIGIVPNIYQDAQTYYYSIWLANQKNKEKAAVETPIEIIHISSPVRHEKRRPLFTFLDEEEDKENDGE